MFSRLAARFTTLKPSSKGATLLFKSVLPKRNILAAPSLILTSLCAYTFYKQYNQLAYNSPASAEQVDPIDVIQAKCAEFGLSSDEEAKLIAYLKRHLESYRLLKGDKCDEIGIIMMLLASHYIAGTDDKAQGIQYGEKACDFFLADTEEEDKKMFLDQLDDFAGIAIQVNNQESIRLHEKSVDYKRKIKGAEFPGLILNYLALGELYLIEGNRDKSAERFAQAKRLLDSISLKEDPDHLYYEACEKFHTATRVEESNVYCQKALGYLKAMKGRDAEATSKEGRAIDIISQNYLALGETGETIKYIQKLNTFLEENLKEKSDPYYFGKGQNAVKIGNIYFDEHKYPEAIINFEEALGHFEKVKDNGKVLIYITKRTMADVFVSMNEYQKAFEALNGAYAAAKDTFGENHPNTKQDFMLLEELRKRGYKTKEEGSA